MGLIDIASSASAWHRRNEFVVTLYNGAIADEVNTPKTGTEEIDLLSFCKTPRTKQEIADYIGVKTLFYVMQHYVWLMG